MPSKLKKIVLPVLMLLSTMVSFAQPTQDQKKLLFDKIDNLLVDYIKYSRFIVDGNDKVDPQSISNFSKLFLSGDVILPDEMSPLYLSKKNLRPKMPPYGLMDAEANKLKHRVPVYDREYDSSYSKLSAFSDSLNVYFKGLEGNRNSFFKTYNDLTAKTEEYNTFLKSQENITERSLSEYIESVESNYPDGFSVRLLNSVVSFNDISNNQVKLLVEKLTIGKLFRYGVKLQMHDTLLLTVQVSNQYSKLLISNIEMIGYELTFLNDRDHDFFADEIDKCPDYQGLFQPVGCPPEAEKNFKSNMTGYLTERRVDSTYAVAYQTEIPPKLTKLKDRIDNLERLINAPPHWMLVFGINYGVVTSSLTDANSNYLEKIRETNGASTFSGGNSIGGFIMGEHYFDTKSHIGLGAGIAFNLISGTIKKDTFHVEYKAQDKRTHFFTQLISAGALEEKVSFTNFSIPIVGIYKGNLTPAFGLKIEAGVALNVYSSAKMKSREGKFNYEAVYNLLKNQNSGVQKDYFDPGTPSSSGTVFQQSSWLITRDFVQKHIAPDKLEAYFATMSSGDEFNVWQGVDHPVEGNTRSNFTLGITFLFRPSIAINFNKGSTLNLGVFYTRTNFSQSNTDYRLINESKTYNTMMDGVSKMSNSNFGINVSYSYSLFYYLSKWKKELSGLR